MSLRSAIPETHKNCTYSLRSYEGWAVPIELRVSPRRSPGDAGFEFFRTLCLSRPFTATRPAPERRAMRESRTFVSTRWVIRLAKVWSLVASEQPSYLTLGDTQKTSEPIPCPSLRPRARVAGSNQEPQYDRLGCWRPACCGPWMASSQGLLAMTDGSPLTRSLR